MEDLETRHRKENKELQASIMTLKKSVPKGDKRKKKEITAEIALLESQLKGKHAAEIAQFNQQSNAATTATITMSQDAETNDNTLDLAQGNEPGSKKMSKAKRRLQRRAEEQKRLQEEAEREADGMVDFSSVETDAIERAIASESLCIHQIRADGHCLYSAFADQLAVAHGQTDTYSNMRSRAANYMRNHRDDFLPFMAHANGDLFTSEDFDTYCDQIEASTEWGGQQEIIALSHSLQFPVLIYQSDAPVLRIGEEYGTKEPLRLSYHKHAYGLGEHYNSLHKKSNNVNTQA